MAEPESPVSNLQVEAIEKFRRDHRKLVANTVMPGVLRAHESAAIIHAAEDSIFNLIDSIKAGVGVGGDAHISMRIVRQHLANIEQCLLSGAVFTPTASTAEALQLGIARIRDKLPTAFAGTHVSLKPAANKGGHPGKWNWEGALIHLIAVANHPDGLPEGRGAQTRLVELMADWFAKHNDGAAPADSDMKKRARLIMEEISP